MQRQVNAKYEYYATVCHIYTFILLIYVEYLASRHIWRFPIVATQTLKWKDNIKMDLK
jgi:hypothetical protein